MHSCFKLIRLQAIFLAGVEPGAEFGSGKAKLFALFVVFLFMLCRTVKWPSKALRYISSNWRSDLEMCVCMNALKSATMGVSDAKIGLNVCVYLMRVKLILNIECHAHSPLKLRKTNCV